MGEYLTEENHFEEWSRSYSWLYQWEYENTENGIEENSFEGNSSI